MARGPVPKRSEDRQRTNEPEVPIEKVEAYGEVEIPDLDLPIDTHPMVLDFYQSLIKSAQSRYFEPSDWEYARITCFVLNNILNNPKRPNSELFKAVQSAMSNLLVTEGDRRRLRLEVTRTTEQAETDPESEEMAKVISMYEEQMNKYFTKEA